MQSLSDASARAHPNCINYRDSNDKYPQTDFVQLEARFATLRESNGGDATSATAGRVGAAPKVLPSGAAAGLVSSQTSVPGTPSPSVSTILIDRQASRLKRLRCSVLTAARLHVQEKTKWKVAMLTTTYRPDAIWQKNQVSDLVRCIRKFLARKSIEFRYVWVQELTKRGRPHYHLLVWLPLGITLPKPDKQGWWPWGMTKIEWARNAVGYIAKYASKGDDYQNYGTFQKGARLHGNGGLTGDALLEQRWWKLPSWLRVDVSPSDRVRRALPHTGGGFFHPETGEAYISPWEVFFVRGQVYIQRKEVQS